MDKEKLSRIQTLLNESVDNKINAGVNCLVLQNGEEVGYYEAGMRDVENHLPIQRDSLFRLYSMSKTVTSAATMILVERGVIDLFDNVSKYIPSFSNPKVSLDDGTVVDAKREVRVGDLLSMTSGLTYLGGPDDKNKAFVAAEELINEIIEKIDTPNALTTFEVASKIGEAPLAFNPGERWKYGLSADVLGAVVEVASEMKLSDFLNKEIFNPLGMKDTAFYVPKDSQDRLAKVYKSTDNGLELYTYDNLGVSNKLINEPAFESGGAGLVATIDDFVAFSQMLLNGGIYKNVRVLSEETVKFMTEYKLSENYYSDIYGMMPHLSGYSYGNLLRVMTNCDRAVTLGCNGEYGWDGWTGTYIANDPTNKLTILMMRQKVDCGTDEITRRLRNIVYASL